MNVLKQILEIILLQVQVMQLALVDALMLVQKQILEIIHLVMPFVLVKIHQVTHLELHQDIIVNVLLKAVVL
jgi:hypothetical protein